MSIMLRREEQQSGETETNNQLSYKIFYKFSKYNSCKFWGK